MDNVLNGVKNLLETIANMFGVVFGFLPSWVIGFVGTGFLIIIAVSVIKFVRG